MTSSLMSSAMNISQANLGLVPPGVKQASDKSGPKIAAKVAGLETLLRKQTTERQNLTNAPGSTQVPNGRHRQLQSSLRYGNDTLYNRYDNHLASFTTQTDQILGVASEAERALQLSTLESKRDISKIQQSNDNLSMLASQRGLLSASARQVKRARKSDNHKLSNSVLY